MSILCFPSLVTTGLVGVFTALIAYAIYKYRINHYWKYTCILYGKTFPFLGYIYYIMRGKNFHDVDQHLYRKYGKVFGTYEGMKPVIFVSEPELLKDIFIRDFHSFVNRRTVKTNNPVTDSMVNFMEGDDWKRVRSIITPTFTTGKLKGMLHLVSDCAVRSTENFVQYTKNDEPVECKKLFGNYTLDVIASVAFGTQLDSHNDPDNVFITNARQVFNRDISIKTLVAIMAPKIANKLGIRLFPVPFFTELVQEIIARRRKNKEVRHDFLDLLMEKLEDQDALDKQNEMRANEHQEDISTIKPLKIEDELDWSEKTEDRHNLKEQIVYSKKSLSLNEVIGNSIIFFLAGYDTTATTLTMVCYNLAHNQDAQKKIQAEVDEIWKNMTAVEAVTKSETRYIDAVIKETLRIFPPAVRIERMAGEDYTLGDTGYTIPKGMIVATPVYSMHRDPENFPEPETFVPERFLPENIDSIKPFTYLPFGTGPRNCVAMRLALMEVKINLIYLLREVEFHLCPQTKCPPDFYNGSALLQPKAVHLKVTKRST